MSFERTEHQGAALGELQGINVVVLAGVAADTKINLAAIRAEDNIVGAVNFNGGVPNDVLGNASVSDIRAAGTISLSSAVAGNKVVVDGTTYEFVSAFTYVRDAGLKQVLVGGTDTISATNLAAAITEVNSKVRDGVTAVGNGTDVEVTAKLEGAVGNAIEMDDTDGGGNISAPANLSGGTDTGGVQFDVLTNDAVIVTWYNKR